MLKVLKATDAAIKWTCVILLAAMTLLVFLNVVLRYLFNSSIIVTEEIGRYMFVWMTFLGSIFAFAENAHIRVGFIIDRLPETGRKVMLLLVDLLMLLCCLLMSVGGWRQTIINMANPAAVSKVPIGLVYLACLVASVGIGGILAVRIVARLAAWKGGAGS